MAPDNVGQGEPARPMPPAPRRLSVRVSRRAEETVVHLTGDLDLGSAAAFEREIGRVEAHDPAILRIVLSELQFIDSTGLRLLANLYRRSLQARRVLWLTPGRASVQRMFEVTLLDQTLPFESTSGHAPARHSPPD